MQFCLVIKNHYGWLVNKKIFTRLRIQSCSYYEKIPDFPIPLKTSLVGSTFSIICLEKIIYYLKRNNNFLFVYFKILV
jgi:hypothetical protein